MKTNIKLLMAGILAVAISGCDNDNQEIIVSSEVTTTTEESVSKYNLLDYTQNVYHDFFKETNNKIGISSLKANSISQPSIVENMSLMEKTSKTSLFINNQKMSTSGFTGKKSEIGSTIYGKKNTFSIIKEGKDGKTSEGSVELYVPELLNITNPSVTNEEGLMPVCYSEGFVLEWNEDPNNEEGLVIIAEYFGENVIPENSTNIHLQNIDVIEQDNGKVILKSSFFNDIPNLALVDLILLRGNVKIEEIDGETYKFYAETHQRLPIILVKDLSTVQREE